MNLKDAQGEILKIALGSGKLRLTLRLDCPPLSAAYSEIKSVIPEIEGVRHFKPEDDADGGERAPVSLDVPRSRLGASSLSLEIKDEADDETMIKGKAEIGSTLSLRIEPPSLYLVAILEAAPLTEISLAQATEWTGQAVRISLTDRQLELPLPETDAKGKVAPAVRKLVRIMEESGATLVVESPQLGISAVLEQAIDDTAAGLPPLSAPAIPPMPDPPLDIEPRARAAWLSGDRETTGQANARPEPIARGLGEVFDSIDDLVIYWGVPDREARQTPGAYCWRVLGMDGGYGVSVRIDLSAPLGEKPGSLDEVHAAFAAVDAAEDTAARVLKTVAAIEAEIPSIGDLRRLHAQLGTDGRTGLSKLLADADAATLGRLLASIGGDPARGRTASGKPSAALLRAAIRDLVV